MSVSKLLRFEIFKRDNFTCKYCGRKVPDVVLEIDHVFPKSKGGEDSAENLITSCYDCNRGKSDKLINTAAVDSGAIQKRMIEAEQQLDEYNKYLSTKYRKINREIAILSKRWNDLWDGRFSFNEQGKASLRKFLAKLDYIELLKNLDIAKVNIHTDDPEHVFKYFCGICWRIIKERPNVK